MAVTVDSKSNKLIIRFRVTGYAKQFYLSTGLKDNKSNRSIVESRWELIQREISLGEFDSTLDRYRFGDKKPKIIKNEELKITKYNLLEIWDKFTDYQETQIEQTTILKRYKSVKRYIDKLPTTNLDDAVNIRDWLLKNTTTKMAILLINHFSQACEWGIKSKIITSNPFAELRMKEKRQKRGKDYQAFTAEQRDLIIKAFEQHPKYSYYASLVKFLFFTGCRLGEAFAVTWGDVSQDCTKVKINKSRNFNHITKGTKNGVERIFPTEAGSKLQKMLLEIKPDDANPEKTIFLDLAGKPLDSFKLQKIWKGQAFQRYRYPGVVQNLANKGVVPYLKAYSTRHTFATLAIASGITPDRVALWIGDTVQTVLIYYCHPEILNSECPDF